MIKENENQPAETGKRYWKSLNDYSESPQFRDWVEREFPQGASMLDGVERRGFMKLMAASFGLAGLGLTSCRRPEHAILPYGKSPEELIPGVPNYYATSMPTHCGFLPLIAESHQGRPTKIEGNPSYLPFGGSTDIYAQASVLNLYDPDRAKGSFERESVQVGDASSSRWKKIGSQDALSKIKDWSTDGKVAILAESSFSAARNHLSAELEKKGVLWAEHDTLSSNSIEKELGQALGQKLPIRTIPKLQKVSRVLSLDCDFMGREPYALANSRNFMSGRKVLKPSDAHKMNRLYSVESDLTLTGGVADHRLRLESSHFVSFSALLAAEVLKLGKKKDQPLIEHLSKIGKSSAAHIEWIQKCALDLRTKPNRSLVLAGKHLPIEVHLAAFAINQSLGSIGKSVDYLSVPGTSSVQLSDLVASIENGEVDSLILLGGNPIHSTSGFIDWSEVLGKVKRSARIGFSLDESSQLCDLHIGQSHFLECWDLGQTWDQTAIIPTQPLLAPLFDTLSDLEFLLGLNDSDQSTHDFVKNLNAESNNQSDHDYMDFLRLGVRKTSTQKLSKEADPQKALLALDAKDFTPAEDSLEVLLVPDFHALDGRFINNGWMQECPHPITKLTWDNALLISPVLAKSLEKDYPNLGLLPKPTMLNKNGQIAPDNAVFDNGYQKAPVVRISLSDDKFIEGPLYVQPGLADQTIVASLGMGRKNTGRVGHGTGYDAFPLLSEDGNRIISDISLKPTGEYQILANTQEHWSMEGRAIVREANLNEYVEDEDFAHHMGAESHSPPIWGKDQDKDYKHKSQTTPRGNSAYEHPDHNYEHSDTPGLHQWGMAIDLNQCTGCSACVVACQSENNIPIVGKDQVLRGREMHWMRLDRYYSSTEREGTDIPSDVQVSFQGVSCMHCETAPCESVCPVNATVHDEEGLNAMAYNRCVGTRYCANNCPYKVRRFNFFDWNKRNINELYKGPLGEENDPLPSMGKNPDVTVRMRGVMEKCTYCVQRIQEAKIRIKVKAQRKAKLTTGLDGSEMKLETKDIKVPDGTIRPACQQVCPSDGVAFGDLSDPDSRVSQLTNDPRNYSVLGYLNTRPRTTYLAKVRNPNPQMPDYSASPHAAREYHDKAHPSHHGDDHHGEHNEQKESKH